MGENLVLILFLLVAFILGPVMTQSLYLGNSKLYRELHKSILIIVILGLIFDVGFLVASWPFFCAFGFFLYLQKNFRFALSVKGFFTCMPFIFSILSSIWFFAGVNDLQMLGYNRTWSFYAALHGAYLGWIFIGCIGALAARSQKSPLYHLGVYFCAIFFLFVAFGIDGVPYIKRIGVVGLTTLVPALVGIYLLNRSSKREYAKIFYLVLFLALFTSMGFALFKEFSSYLPQMVFNLPIMVAVHGLLNVVFIFPSFFYLIYRNIMKDLVIAENKYNNIVFYDGLCVLCNGSVSFLLKLDKYHELKFSSLQGEYAKEVLTVSQISSVRSIVFYRNGNSYEKIEAVIAILYSMGWAFKLAAFILDLFPQFILNIFYDIIAYNRYRIFGKNDTCLLPSGDQKKFFIP